MRMSLVEYEARTIQLVTPSKQRLPCVFDINPDGSCHGVTEKHTTDQLS